MGEQAVASTSTGGLVERAGDVSLLATCAQDALRGHRRFVVVEGPAGIGKSSLLEAAAADAAATGLRWLGARASELERGVALGVARQLLLPALAALPVQRRERLLVGPAALARPALDADAGPADLAAPTGARQSTLHGLYWLVANLADETPLALVVDDVQWADEASLGLLVLLARRLEELPLLLLVAHRPGESPPAEALLAELVADPAARVLRPAPLSRDGVGRLLTARLAEPADQAFADVCHEATGGNPFLTLELARQLEVDAVAPRADQAKRVAGLAPDTVARSVVARLLRLGPQAAALARACAVLGDHASLRHAATMAGLDEHTAAREADRLVRASIFAREDALSFAHPIMRRAVYRELPPPGRARAHIHAAALLSDEGADGERIAVHLVLTEPAGDERVVALLQEAAAISLGRGAPEQAAIYLRRALAEPPSGRSWAHVLRDLGIAETHAGSPTGPLHLADALALSALSERGEIAEQLAIALTHADRHAEAIDMLRQEIPRVAALDREMALRLEATMLSTILLANVPFRQADDLMPRLARLRGVTPGERLLLANGAWYAGRIGASADEAVELAHRALAGGRLLAEQSANAFPFWLAVFALMSAERYDEHQALLDEGQREAARRGAAYGFALALFQRAMSAYTRGLIADSIDESRTAVQAADAIGWIGGLPYVRGTMALAHIEQGEPDLAESVLDEHVAAAERPLQPTNEIVLLARAKLRLVQGRPADALGELRLIAGSEEKRGARSAFYLYSWRAASTRALLALGQRADARRVAEEQLAIGRRWGRPRAIAAGLRSVAATEEGDARVGLLREALSLLEGSQAGLERMHALLELGTALRRLRRESESREPLLAALEVAERAGAGLVAERARAELAATGVTRRKRMFLAGVDALTPSEQRVAAMAARGMSNPEIAQSLFVSRKTVEKHLGNAYGKLGIASREALPAALAGGQE